MALNKKDRSQSVFSTMLATTKVMLLSRAWAAASLILLLLVLHGSRGHCAGLGMEAELEIDSEAHRLLLWAWEATTGRRYISYDALRGDVVPCSRTGVPYYNCRISTTANPYTRGCESITRCRDSDP
ncbi:hypothetical protein U9M48_003329 [Paspalum notatum var. saurae]|uniref:Protein RALF-like 33 n=1 Tax=Paspalum notatum var. saurae TaxID=547442 RepID=A0AAQ3PT57_PASNO